MAKRFRGIETEWEEAQALIAERKIHLFPSEISDSKNKMADWPDDKPLGGFLDLAHTLGVQLIYARLETFSDTTLVELEDFALGETKEGETILLSSSDVEKLKDNARQYMDRPFYFSLEWLYQGIIHGYFRTADWYEDLLNLATELQEVSEQRQQERQALQSNTLEEHAALVAHSKAFKQARTYAARIAATKKLYPGEEAHRLMARALEIYDSEIVPRQEEATAQKARKMLNSGVSMTKTAAQLGMSPGKLERILARFEVEWQIA